MTDLLTLLGAFVALAVIGGAAAVGALVIFAGLAFAWLRIKAWFVRMASAAKPPRRAMR